MLRTITAVALMLCGAACADTDDTDAAPEPVLDGDVLSADICEMPVETDGPCALACNEDELVATHIPAGVCITFACTREDGTPYLIGGCNPG